MIFQEKLIIHTHSNEQEIKEKLMGLIESSGGALQFYYGSKPYVGKIDGNKFKIWGIKPTSMMSAGNINSIVKSIVNILFHHQIKGRSDIGALPVIQGRFDKHLVEITLRPKISDFLAPFLIPAIFLIILAPYLIQNENNNAQIIISILVIFVLAYTFFYVSSYQRNMLCDKEILYKALGNPEIEGHDT